MSGERVIVAVRYTPASQASLRRAVGGFLRYIHYRDKHEAAEKDVEGMLKYVAYRDRSPLASARARVFGPEGPAGDVERRALLDFVARSLRGSRPQGRPGPGGQAIDYRRAVYRFVISPEFAQGLDLEQLTRAAIGQLQRDAGPGKPLRWLAAEHRNTAHPHVHVVVAGMREAEAGRFRTLVVNKQRLARIKAGALGEIQRQRELGKEPTGALLDRADHRRPPVPVATPAAIEGRRPKAVARVWRSPVDRPQARDPWASRRLRGRRPHGLGMRGWRLPAPRLAALRRAAAHYRREAERLAEDERRRQRERSA